MSTDSSNQPETKRVPWNPIVAIFFVLAVFYVSQIIGGALLSIYPSFKHWTTSQATAWLNDSVAAQFTFVLIAEVLSIWAIYLFLKQFKVGWASIGLKKPRLRDVVVGFAAAPVYYILYLGVVSGATALLPKIDINQEQQIGFGSVHGPAAMIMTYISLAVLPPIAEEIMVRGFLYSSLKKALPTLWAVLATSAIFAAAHLPEGGASGPLWIGAIDTFVLSLVLIYLREKTGSLWASITLHAIKNSVAFFALFVFGGR
jgi:membrane protease YdiL (CAAX protease family)